MSLRAISYAGGERITIFEPAGTSRSERDAFAASVRSGLLATPKTLPWPYFYDERGSRLFDRICTLPEYYLTRTEDALLAEHAAAMVAGWNTAPTLVELGSGSATKTRRLIGAAIARYGALDYVPIDVSPTFIYESAKALLRTFPALRVTGHVGDYRLELARATERIRGPKLFLFLGSSLGNYEPEVATDLLRQLAWVMGPDDRFLLGADLDKDPAILLAAYDDAQRVTAEFNLNLLARINRELGGDFHLAHFTHEARYRPNPARIEMHVVSLISQIVTVAGARMTVELAAGESIHTENSYKYTPSGLRALGAAAGLEEEAAWTDARGFFRVQRWKHATNM